MHTQRVALCAPPYTQSFGVKKSKAGFPYVILCPGSEHRALHKTAFFLHWTGLALYVFSTGTSRALREYIRCMHRAFPYFLPAFFKNITQFFLQSQCMFPLVPTVGKLCAYRAVPAGRCTKDALHKIHRALQKHIASYSLTICTEIPLF